MASPPAPGRVFENEIPATAGDTDPLETEHAGIARGKLRSDFKPEEFQRVLLQHGKRLIWRKAMHCPNINSTTGQPDLDCANCDGSGYVYVDPIEIQALMLSFDEKTRLYEKFGLWVSGEAMVTVEQAYRIGFRDSLEMVDELMNYNEIIKKGDRHGKRSGLGERIDTARYRIQNLTKVIVGDANKNVVALNVGSHLKVNDDGQIEWQALGETLVTDDQYVSIHYDFHPVYLVISHPHVLRSDLRGSKVVNETITPLPLQAGVQLDFIANDDPNTALPTTGL
jgi:hypothetical protein